MKKSLIFIISLLLFLLTSCSYDPILYDYDAQENVMDNSLSRYLSVLDNNVISLAIEAREQFYPQTRAGKVNSNVNSVIPFTRRVTKSSQPDTLFYIVNFGDNDGFLFDLGE